MKTISTKPRIVQPKINIQLPKRPNFGVKTPRIPGLKNPFRISK